MAIGEIWSSTNSGAIGVFTEFRNQIRMAQQKSLELVASKIEEPIMKINKIEPQLISAKNYLNQGDTLEVRVGIIAYDSNATYPINIPLGIKNYRVTTIDLQ